MRFSLLQYKRQKLASWSLILVSIVLVVCFSQNSGLSLSCSLAPTSETTEQLQHSSTSQVSSDAASQCHNSEHLVNAHTIHLDFAIPMFILALIVLAAILKQAGATYLLNEPITYYGVRRHLALCTFQE